MIRRLIILLLIVGCVFGDTIKWQDSNAKDKGKTFDIANVEFLYTKYNRLYYLDYRGVKVVIECSWVISITDSEGNEIEFECGDDSNEIYEEEIKVESSKDVQSIIQNTQKSLVGGIFIAIGGGLLFSNIDKECLDCIYGESRYEEYVKDLESTQKIGYGFIILGGILLGLGI